MKLNIKSKKGFTLIELLVVIGILAVLAAIAIPSVAGLIDRANVSADSTNSNEMTNAMERFASEYELFCQDIASGTFDKNDMDSAQSRVYNVLGVENRNDISSIEIDSDATVGEFDVAIYRDTKYPANAYTAQLIVQNYMKTSSSTFEPKQSDMHYWYSPDCGVVVFAESNADQDKENKLNAQIQSGMDAKGNQLGPDTQWINLTNADSLPEVGKTLEQYTWEEVYNIIRAGKATKYDFTVGSTKTFQFNNTTKTATIVGLNHDGRNTVTFMIFDGTIIGVKEINATQTNAGGWEASQIRHFLNNDFYNSMVSIKDYIKPVNKLTNNVGYNASVATETSEKIFLPSAKEVGLNEDKYNNEGTTYQWFVNNTFSEWFWTRTPTFDNEKCFLCYGNGEIGMNHATTSHTIRPLFVIG